ncbi:MAG: alpha/beta fold hydrolase [Halochromatium sp.]|uniref:alpha/beta fold hydrolase n=2 Tax=Halochromatium sp. TaxID=2049430 RepID=UPI00397B03EE
MHNDRPTLVLLHGWGMNNGVWDALPASISERFHLHPIELPGHGNAPFQSHWRDLPDWADAVLAQAPEQAIWLGWSLGALVALQAALHTRTPGRPIGPGQQAPAQEVSSRRRAPSRIRALILVTANPRFVQAADWRAAMPATTFDGFHAALRDEPAATLARFLSLQVRGSEDARETLRRLRAGLAERPQPQPEALLAGLDLLREEDLRARLADIQQPALWLFGERDTLVPASVAERIELLMPQAQCQTIPGAAHAPLLSHGDEAANRITAFLAETLP